jgi:hypothetical protein
MARGAALWLDDAVIDVPRHGAAPAGTSLTSRVVLLPAALALVLYAGCVAFEATRLSHTGAWTLWLSAAVLVAAAIGLVARQLWAYVFAVLVLGSTTLAYVILAALVGREALTGSGHDDWAGVRGVVLGGLGLVVLAVAVASSVAVVALGIGRRALSPSRSALASVLATIGALGAIALLGWLVGYRYWHLELRAQNQCLSGAPGACRALAGEPHLFTKQERIGFARRGCEAGGDGSCEALASFLGTEHPEASAEVRALAARCQAGRPQVCQRLGAHLLTIGDRTNGERYLMQACDQLHWCESAAREAQKHGAADLSRQLLEKGCAGEDARSCTALLRQVRTSLGPDELQRLELRPDAQGPALGLHPHL